MTNVFIDYAITIVPTMNISIFSFNRLDYEVKQIDGKQVYLSLNPVVDVESK